MMILNTTRITVKPDKRLEFFQTIGRLMAPGKEIKGRRTFAFYVDVTDENSALLVSEWDTESDLNDYLSSYDFAILRGAIMVLSTSSVDSRTLVTSEVLF
jgi:quinol monooxygenase YgiN